MVSKASESIFPMPDDRFNSIGSMRSIDFYHVKSGLKICRILHQISLRCGADLALLGESHIFPRPSHGAVLAKLNFHKTEISIPDGHQIEFSLPDTKPAGNDLISRLFQIPCRLSPPLIAFSKRSGGGSDWARKSAGDHSGAWWDSPCVSQMRTEDTFPPSPAYSDPWTLSPE